MSEISDGFLTVYLGMSKGTDPNQNRLGTRTEPAVLSVPVPTGSCRVFTVGTGP